MINLGPLPFGPISLAPQPHGTCCAHRKTSHRHEYQLDGPDRWLECRECPCKQFIPSRRKQ